MALESPNANEMQAQPSTTPVDIAPEHLGTDTARYKLLQRLGEGGMGTVFLADQEEPVRRRVALKIIKPGLDSERVLARFEAERQAFVSIEAILAIAFTLLFPACGKAGDDKAKAEQAGLPLHAALKGLTSIHRVVFSPDGKILVTMAGMERKDRTAKLWDVATGQERATLKGPQQPYDGFDSVHFSPDSATLATNGLWDGNRMVKLWNVATGQERATLNFGRFGVYGVVFSRNGKTVAVIGLEDTITVRDAATGQERATLKTREVLWSPQPPVLSPDGKTLLTAEKDGTIKLWGPATGRERLILQGTIKDLLKAVFSPDGKILVTMAGMAGKDRTVKLWDVGTGQERATLKTPTNNHGLIFSPDGKTLATFLAPSQDSTLKLWDVATAKERHTLQEVAYWEFSPDGKTLTTGLGNTSKLWDVATGKLRAEFKAVNRTAFTPDGKTLATAGADGTVKLWDATTAQLRDTLRLKGQAGPISVAFSPDGKTLLTYLLGTVQLWDVATSQDRATFQGQFDSCKFSPDSKTLAMQVAGVVRLWDVATGKERATLEKVNRTVAADKLVFSPDGKTLATRFGTEIKLWDVTTGQLHAVLYATPIGGDLALRGPAREPVSRAFDMVVFSPDSKTVATPMVMDWATARGGFFTYLNALQLNDWGTTLWDVATGQERATFKGVRSVAFSPESNTLVAVGQEPRVKIWELATGQERAALNARPAKVGGPFILSPDGNTLVTMEEYSSLQRNGTLKLWDVTTGMQLATLVKVDHDARPDAVLVFSPDGKTLATVRAGIKPEIKLWEAMTGRERATLHWATGDFLSSLIKAVFSPDGKILATLGFMKKGGYTIKLWNTATGQERATLKEPTGQRAIFSPDSKILATMTQYDTVKLWDTATGKERTTLTGVLDAVFSPDGKTLVTQKRDGVKLWDVATSQERATLSWQQLMAVSPDGSLLATYANEVVRLWRLTPKK